MLKSDFFHYPDMSTDVIWSQCVCRSDGSVAAICSPSWGSGSCVSHYITGRNNTPVSVVWKWPTTSKWPKLLFRLITWGGGALWQPPASDGLSHPEASQDVLVSPLGSSQIGHLSIQSVVWTYMDVNCSLTVSAAGRIFFFFHEMSLLVDQHSCHIILNEQQKFSSPGDGQK